MTECPYTKEGDRMCMALVREMRRARCWADMLEIHDAILTVRRSEKSHTDEWHHLNPEPQGEDRTLDYGELKRTADIMNKNFNGPTPEGQK